jgi:hypothetical protein
MFDIREGDSLLGYSIATKDYIVGIVTDIKLDAIARKQYNVHWADAQVGWLDHNTAVRLREKYLDFRNK